jgi:quinol monooxygenase YgiN
MYVRIVTFHLDGITVEQYEAHCEQIAEAFNDWPGLIAKVWLRDADNNTFGGVYLFESKEAADRSRATEIFAGMTDNPNFADLSVTEYGTVGAATAITARAVHAGRV